MKKKILFAAFLMSMAAGQAMAQKQRVLEEGGTGAYKAVMMEESSLDSHTIFRPQDLSKFSKKNPMPVVVWGNGGCAESPSGHVNFLNEVASQGFLIVAIGPSNYEVMEAPRPGQTGDVPQMGAPGQRPRREGGRPGGNGQGPRRNGGMPPMGGGMPPMGGGMPPMGGGGMPPMGGGAPQGNNNWVMGDPLGLQVALDWVLKQNEDPNSPYYQKLDVDNIAAAGMSCGGLQALHMSDNEKIKTILVMNSGYFGDNEKATLDQMKAKSVIWILGGSSDIAYDNGWNDFKTIQKKPAFACSLNTVGHGGTYMEPHGGEYAIVATAWLQWQLQGNKEAGKMFEGSDFTLAKRPNWTAQKKNIK